MFTCGVTKVNLPIYGVRQKNLGAYTTQAGDVAKGISRVPLPLARLNDQDLLQIEQITKSKFKPQVRDELSDVENDLSLQFQQKLELRNSDSSGNEQPETQDLNETFFKDCFEHRVKAR